MEHITVEEREALAFGLSYERELEYSKLSPFEITDILEEESIKGCKRRQVEECTILNSGRGNPNFLNTVVRKAFAKLILFSTEIANSLAEEEFLGYRPKKEGIADRLEEYLQQDKSKEGQFLQKAITYAQERFQFNKDDFVFEMVDGALGDFYPYPSRILPHTANLINAYLSEILMVEDIASDQFNFFATEGATQAMVYSFRSLKENGILHRGDKVATITPIFAPYLQIPKLDDYELINIEIKESEEMEWQIPEGELRKLEDEEIKVLYLVNPINPSSVTIDSDTIDKIAELVKNKRRDLIIMTDTVYANFVEGFYSLVSAIPENTICIYSYSKYFGVTGWRLGAIMLHQDNVVDRLISELSPQEKERLKQRYSIISTEPDEIKFIDRLVIDSRDVALAHTGGLSTPQQIIISLFSLFNLMDKEKIYKGFIKNILERRIEKLYSAFPKGYPYLKGNNKTHYYALINIVALAREEYGEEFANYLVEHFMDLDFIIRLAGEKGIICLAGRGFEGPEWTLRVSLANLYEDDYLLISQGIMDILKDYYQYYEINH